MSGVLKWAFSSNFNYKRLDDGGLLGIYRDITELKEREEALAAARKRPKRRVTRAETRAPRRRTRATRIERTREIMQTVLDNMSDGVMPVRQGQCAGSSPTASSWTS